MCRLLPILLFIAWTNVLHAKYIGLISHNYFTEVVFAETEFSALSEHANGSYHPIKSNEGQPQEKCQRCNGTGNIPCPDCGGKGYISAGTIHGQPAAYGCARCGGVRGDPFNGPPGSPGKGYIQCPDCGGTGQVSSSNNVPSSQPLPDNSAERQRALEEQQKREAEETRQKQEAFEKSKEETLKSMKGIEENDLGLKGVSTGEGFGLKNVGEGGTKEAFMLAVKQDKKRYRSQLQRLMNEADHIKVPPPTVPKRIHDGVMLGLYDPQSEVDVTLKSPFTGKLYDKQAVFATTDSKGASEIIRGLLDNHYLGQYTINTSYGEDLIGRLTGTHFDRLLAHSNGATVAEALIRRDIITVDELDIAGGDRSLINKLGLQELIQSGKVKRIVVWVNPGDIVPPGSSTLLPTPAGATGGVPLTTTALYFAELLSAENKGGQSKVEYRWLNGNHFKGQRLPMHFDSTFFDAHKLKTYTDNISIYFHDKKAGKD